MTPTVMLPSFENGWYHNGDYCIVSGPVKVALIGSLPLCNYNACVEYGNEFRSSPSCAMTLEYASQWAENALRDMVERHTQFMKRCYMWCHFRDHDMAKKRHNEKEQHNATD
jgi:hypothetical protein